ncbi:MAG: magnesium chelatase [Saprospiraceae bacterium]
MKQVKTLGELKATKYQPKSIKEELRANLIKKLQKKDTVFEGILGFEDTVLPDLERAILSKHNILLLGLRGQAKTRLARLMVKLLDEYVPVVAGSELNDDPLAPISKFAFNLIAEKGDDTPIEWLHREDRYVEKLATPDVSIADLVGDVDPIKAATLKLPYSDERVIHFGLIPRSHRCIFVINELPDLQARIQVSLFNILQEGDMQIRGFKLRLPLEVQFVFTANPEDYTNRGSIITPLKDRIESQILTHYPKTMEIARTITSQEANLSEDQEKKIEVPEMMKIMMERISFQARESEYIDEKSGVSARLSISGYENLVSTAERRMLINNDKKTRVRITDFWGVVPAITGKVELVYEGEQEGPYNVAMKLMSAAIKDEFMVTFPNPEKLKKGQMTDPYGTIRAWFSGGNEVDFLNDMGEKEFKKEIEKVAGLKKFVEQFGLPKEDIHTYMELVLHGLASFNIISKDYLESRMSFADPLASMFDDEEEDDPFGNFN